MKNINKAVAVLGVAIAVVACQKSDDYKKFTKGGEIIYPAKIDSLKILPGNGRVKVSGALNADPRVVRYRVFWNNRQDSVDVPVTRTTGIDSVNYIINGLEEGPMSFEVRTYDKDGHISVPMNLVGNIYGERYRLALNNRGILSTEFNAQNEAKLKFQDINIQSGIISMQIKYKHLDNTTHDTVVVAELKDQVVTLPKFKVGNPIELRVINKPDPLSIDVFKSEYGLLSLKGDVSSIYLKNYAIPMSRSAYDGNRWGTLAIWTTNAAMKNHKGDIGGYASDDGGVIQVETGWNDAKNITNGKIYQTVTLPAGKYAFETELSDNNFDNGDPNAYIVATAGSEISSIENISSSLGSTKVKNRRFEFTLTQATSISLGLVVTFPEYRYMKIKGFKLYML